MSNEDKSGPAFPQHMVDFGKGPESPDGYGMGGMTLRDWFAAQALVGLAREGWTEGEIADACYKQADAMLKARNA